MHCGEKTSSKNTCNTQHMERVHKDVMFCLEYQPLGRTGTYVSIGIGLYHQSILLDCRALVSYYIPRLEYRLVSEPYTEVSSVSWMLIAVSIKDLGFQQFTRFILHIGLVYVVKGSRNSKRHSIRERTLTKGID
jgi:hypothetical protein